MFKDIFTSIVMYAAFTAADRVTWLGLYQPKKPKNLHKR